MEDIVILLWVIIKNFVWVFFFNSSRIKQNFSIFLSSKAASTSSKIQIGDGFIKKIEKINAIAVKVFSPPEAEVNKAKRILEELDKAAKEGKGAAQLDGRMIDAASARMAENIVNIDKLINKK